MNTFAIHCISGVETGGYVFNILNDFFIREHGLLRCLVLRSSASQNLQKQV